MNLVCLIVLLFPSGLISYFSVRWAQVELPFNLRKLFTAIHSNEKNQLDVSFSDGKQKSPPIKCNCKHIGYHFSASPHWFHPLTNSTVFCLGWKPFPCGFSCGCLPLAHRCIPSRLSVWVSDQASFTTFQDGSSHNQHNASDGCHLPVCPLG